MNRNGIWDLRETPTEAWRRLRLLAEGEELSTDKYLSCVRGAAEALQAQGFFTRETVSNYVDRARAQPLR